MVVVTKFVIFSHFMLVIQLADTERFFIATTSAESTPCDFDINKCKAGSCRQTELSNGRNFLCACPPKKTGVLCDKPTPECLACETRIECTGFVDGTAFCICTKFKEKDKKYKDHKTPSICYFHKKKNKDKHADCLKGKHNCTSGQECVNYGEIVCQCPVGNTRGENCEEDFELDIPGDRNSCVDTKAGPLCLCEKYGRTGKEHGLCKAEMMVETLASDLNDNGPCSFDRNKCRHGTCIEIGKNKFVCSCRSTHMGRYCHIKRPQCDHCVESERSECLSLSDGTAFCICHEYKDNIFPAPSVCYFRKFLRSRQRNCATGNHGCQRGEHCVNFSHRGPEIISCLCVAGISRGKNCVHSYDFIDLKNEQHECLDTSRGPVCLCKYFEVLGFCRAKMKNYAALMKNEGGPCGEINNRCHEGTCVETEKKGLWESICACSKGFTGELCHYEMFVCDLCEMDKLVDCLGLEDNSALCICTWFKDPKKYGIKPQICYTDIAKPDKQTKCKNGQQKCGPGKKCVEYTKVTVCQCPAGQLRGKDCKQEYALTDAGENSCVDTDGFGPVCLCNKYPDFAEGFCKPKLKKTKANGSCKASEDMCKKGTCVGTKAKNGWTNLCSCPVGTTGNLCHEEMYPCEKCGSDARLDCIGFTDGTAVCICVEFKENILVEQPAICFFKKFEKHRQSLCEPGKHDCDSGQDCVNYAQSGGDIQVTCQCPVGKKRGKNCREEYMFDTPGGKFSCVDTGKHGTLCICEKYGRGIDKYGFCKPESKS